MNASVFSGNVGNFFYLPVGVTGVQRRAIISLKYLFCLIKAFFHGET